MMFDRFLSWFYIYKIWGPRCPDFEPGCLCCQRWKEHGEVFND